MKIPASAQDVSYDKALSSETIPSCNSHYSTRMHNNLYNNVSGGECPVGGKKKNYILWLKCAHANVED